MKRFTFSARVYSAKPNPPTTPIPDKPDSYLSRLEKRLSEKADSIRKQEADPTYVKKGYLENLNRNLASKAASLESQPTKKAKQDYIKQKMDHLFNQEGNLKERNRLMEKAFSKGYFDDAKQVASLGAKLWIAKDTESSRINSPQIVAINASDLLKNQRDLMHSCLGKISLVTFFFNAFGEPHVNSFIYPFKIEFSNRQDVQVLQVHVEETWTKVPILKMLVPFIRKRIPAVDHGSYLMVYEDLVDVRPKIGITNKVLGWSMIVDELGFVRWIAHGIAVDQEIRAMKIIVEKLAKEMKKR